MINFEDFLVGDVEETLSSCHDATEPLVSQQEDDFFSQFAEQLDSNDALDLFDNNQASNMNAKLSNADTSSCFIQQLAEDEIQAVDYTTLLSKLYDRDLITGSSAKSKHKLDLLYQLIAQRVKKGELPPLQFNTIYLSSARRHKSCISTTTITTLTSLLSSTNGNMYRLSFDANYTCLRELFYEQVFKIVLCRYAPPSGAHMRKVASITNSTGQVSIDTSNFEFQMASESEGFTVNWATSEDVEIAFTAKSFVNNCMFQLLFTHADGTPMYASNLFLVKSTKTKKRAKQVKKE